MRDGVRCRREGSAHFAFTLAFLEVAHHLDPLRQLSEVRARSGSLAPLGEVVLVGIERARRLFYGQSAGGVLFDLEDWASVIGRRVEPLQAGIAPVVVNDSPYTPTLEA